VDQKELLAEVVVNAATSIAETVNGKTTVDLDNIQIQKQQGGSIDDTEVVKGIILDKERVHEEMPKQVKNAKIALINAALEVKKTEIDARIQINDPTQLQAFLDEEENMLRKMVETGYIPDNDFIKLFIRMGNENSPAAFFSISSSMPSFFTNSW
jgi:chaperonin GroEL (HSP60 family)